jgi:hypothetical protein
MMLSGICKDTIYYLLRYSWVSLKMVNGINYDAVGHISTVNFAGLRPLIVALQCGVAAINISTPWTQSSASHVKNISFFTLLYSLVLVRLALRAKRSSELLYLIGLSTFATLGVILFAWLIFTNTVNIFTYFCILMLILCFVELTLFTFWTEREAAVLTWKYVGYYTLMIFWVTFLIAIANYIIITFGK